MTQQIDCVELYSVPAFFSVKVEMNTRACVESYEGYQIPRHFCLMSLWDVIYRVHHGKVDILNWL